METVIESISFIEKNQEVKNFVNQLVSKDDIQDLFLQSNDPFSLLKIGKTCILQWNIILKKYESFLNRASESHFKETFQVKPFEERLKVNIIAIFKLLIYLMKNTFNHELYILDQSHVNYLYSYDLDVSFHSFLFHNEFYNDIRFFTSEKNLRYFKLVDLNFYTKKTFEISSDFETDRFNLKYSFKEDNINKLLDEIKNDIKKNVGYKHNLDIYKFHCDSAKNSLIGSEIFKYEYYKDSQSQKLLAIEILANLLTLKICFSYKFEIFIYSIYMALSSSLEDYLIDSLTIFANNVLILAQYHKETEESLSYKDIIKNLHYKLGSINFNAQNTINLKIFNKFNIFCNYLNKDCIKKQEIRKLLQELDYTNLYKLYPYICYIFHDQSFFKDFVNSLLANNIPQTLNFMDMNDYIENIFNNHFKHYEDYNEFMTLTFDLLTKIIIYTFNDMHLNNRNEFAIFFYQYLSLLIEKITSYNFIVADHIIRNILEVFLHEKNQDLSSYSFRILYYIFQYYFEKRNGITVTSALNMISLIRLQSLKNITSAHPFYIEKILDMNLKNPEFSLFLLHFPSEQTVFHDNIAVYLSNQISYSIDINIITKMINDMNNITYIDMNIFANSINFFKCNNFTTTFFSFLKNRNEAYLIEVWFSHTFHFIRVLNLIKLILESKNSTIMFNQENTDIFAVNLSENCYVLSTINTIFDIKILIINRYFNNSLETCLIAKVFHLLILEIEIANSDQNTSGFFKMLSKICIILENLNNNLPKIYQVKDYSIKYEIIKKFVDLVAEIYKKLFLSMTLPLIRSENLFGISNQDIYLMYDSISNSKMDIIPCLLYLNYFTILDIICLFCSLPILKAPDGQYESIGFIYFLRKISSNMSTCDPNLIFIYLRYINENKTILYQYEYNDLIDILTRLVNHSVEYYSIDKNNILRLQECLIKILSILLQTVNLLDDKKIYECLDTTLTFINNNLICFSVKHFLTFLTEISLYFCKVEKIISNLWLFSKVLELIARLDSNCVNPINNFSGLLENTHVLDFLNLSLSNLSYLDFFIEAQKKDDSILLLITKHINTIKSPVEYFSTNNGKISKYLKICRINIETNIAHKKSINYCKDNILVSYLYLDFDIIDVFLYHISLIRLSNYSNIISKKEIYYKFNIYDVIRFIEDKYNKTPGKIGVILEHAYTYVRCLFEDKIYLISSFIYVSEYYNGLTDDGFLEYFNKKFVYASEIQNYGDILSNIIKDEDIKLNLELVHDIIQVIKHMSYFSRIIALQFLSEIIATFPSLLYIIEKDIIDTIDDFLENTNILADIFWETNSREWNLNFIFGYFITVLLYRGNLCYTKELIGKICLKLKGRFGSSSMNYILLVYKILSSEICCCKYIQYLNKNNRCFYDKNCKNNFKQRKEEIFKLFLSNDILNILLLKCKEVGMISNDNLLYFKNNVINVLNIFIEYMETKHNSTIHKKYFTNGLFRFYIPDSNHFLIPKPLIKSKYLEVFQVHYFQEMLLEILKEDDVAIFSSLKNIDYAYIIKYHDGIGGSINYKEITFFNREISCIAINLNSHCIDDIKIIEDNFTLERTDRSDLNSFVFKNRSDYNCKEDFIREILSNLYLVEHSSTLSNIFMSDTLLIQKYTEMIGKKTPTEIYPSEYLSDLPKIYSSDQIFIYKTLAYLCTFSNIKYFCETVEQIKTLISYLRLKELSYKKLCAIFDPTVLVFGFNRTNSGFSEKLECFKKIVIFLVEKKTFILDNLYVDLIFFEAIFLEKNQWYFLNDLFSLLENKQSKQNNSLFFTQIVDNSIVLNAMNRFKSECDCIIEPLLTIFTVYSEKMEIFILATYFSEDINLTKMDYFYREFDRFLSLLNETVFIDNPEKVNCALKFFDKIGKNPLKYFSKIYQNNKNEALPFIFVNYAKIIVKCCQIYSLIREKIHTDIEFKYFEQNFIAEDFICFLFDIDLRKIYLEEPCLETKAKLNNIYPFFCAIKQFLPNINEVFSNLKCLSTDIKLQILMNLNKNFWAEDLCLFLEIDRQDVTNSTIDCFINTREECFTCESWKVKFIGEEGQGIGLLYDFLGLYGKEMNENHYFAPFKSLGFATITASSPEEHYKMMQQYYYTGIIMAKSIILKSAMCIDFPIHFYLFLIQGTLGINDLRIIDPEFLKCLNFYKNYEDLESLCLFFAVSIEKIGEKPVEIELIENGSNIQVTKENIDDYIQKITEFKIYRNMKSYLDKLREGFSLVFNGCFKELFNPFDFKKILEGEKVIDVKQWKSKTKYIEVFDANHKVIKWFWKFVENSDEATRKKLVYFLTGLKSLPIGGFASSKFMEESFTISPGDSKNIFPKVQTCSNLLILPLYDDENTLIERMKCAIEIENYSLI